MFNKLSAFIFAFIAFLSFPLSVFASSGTFTASSVSYNPSTHFLSFQAASFVGLTGSSISQIAIDSCNTEGCRNVSTEFWCPLSVTPSDPVDLSCTLVNNSYRPSSGTVYVTLYTDGVNFYTSQALNYDDIVQSLTPTPTPTVTLTPTPSTPPGTSQMYVTNSLDNTVSVVNSATDAVIATVPVGAEPLVAAATPDGSHIYVANNQDQSISVINSANFQVSTIAGVGPANGIAVNPDGAHVYVPITTDNSVKVINTQTNTIDATIGVGSTPLWVVVSPDGSKAYVSNNASSSISVINTQNNTVSGTIANLSATPLFMALTPNGNTLYVTTDNQTVLVIDTASGSVTATIPMTSSVYGVTVSPDGSKVYVGNNIPSGKITVINTQDNTIVTSIPVGEYPDLMAISTDGTRLFVPNNGCGCFDPTSNTLSVINTTNNAVIDTITVGHGPYQAVLGNAPGVVNNAPVIQMPTNAIINEGATYSATGSFTDPDSISWTGRVNYGDGSGEHDFASPSENIDQANKTFSISHVYTTPGTYTLTVKITDNQGATGTATTSVTVVATTTVDFNDRSANTPLNGTYSGIDWGTGVWDVDATIPTDSTNSTSFHSSSVTSGTFSFSAPSILLSTGIYSNSNQTALITLSCSGNDPVNMQVAPNSSATLTTNWTTACTTVTVTSSNGWNTNLDNLVYSSIQNPGVTPNPTPTPPSGPTGGYTTQGALLDTGDANYMNGSKFITNGTGGTATSMSVFVGNVDTGTHNKYQMAIYTDNGGHPGTLVAKTATGTLTPLSWNTLSISATLNANTTYWLAYNTNSTNNTNYLNNMYYDPGSEGIAAYASHNYGTWPTNFPSATLSNTLFSLYVTY